MSDQPPSGPPHWGPPPYGGGPQYPPPYGAPPPSGDPAYPPYPVPDHPPPPPGQGYPPPPAYGVPYGSAYQQPVPARLPPVTEPLPYHQLHRAGRRDWWRSVVGIVVLAAVVIVIVPAILSIGLMVYLFATGADLGAESERLLSLDDPTPFGLAFLNIVLAAAIPTTFLLTWVLHGLKPRWVTSVFPRMRWTYFLGCLGLSVVALIATVFVSVLVPSEPVGDLGGGLNAFTTETVWFLLVVLLLTPLQSAGEEYAFRGYLTQAFGGLFPTYVAVIGPALLFALAHGVSQDLPVFFDRFAFGLVAGILVVRTGGLEAGIAMHVLNNFLAFGLALAFGDLGESLNPTGGSWWSIPVTLTQSLVYLGLALWLARKMGLARTADPAVLAASRGRV